MRNLNIKLVLIALVVMLFTAVNTVAQVGIGTTTPDASSMLDVNVDDLAVDAKKGVLIPRMNSTERVDIPTPANGLLVFDTTSNSFWYYKTDTWKELVGSNSLVDADGDTKIEVEKVADTDPDGDEINFTTRGTERMKIGNDGEVLMGTDLSDQATTFFEIGTDGTIKLGNKGASTTTGGVADGPESDKNGLENYTKITADGSLSYVGNATRWEDLRIPMNATNRGTSNQPEWLLWRSNSSQGVWLWSFSKNVEEELYFVAQMPHGWKEGTDIYPHIHWTTKASASGNVKWSLEYTWSNVGEAFSVPTIISSAAITKGDANTAFNHNLTSLPVITGALKTLSSMLVCRVFRDGDHGDDDLNDEVQILELDFHYQVDSDGSNQEFTKE